MSYFICCSATHMPPVVTVLTVQYRVKCTGLDVFSNNMTFFLSLVSLCKLFLQPSILPTIRLIPSSQFNLTDLDWGQMSTKDCVKYGGTLVGNACKYVPDLALMSFILFFGTYSMTISLKKFKFSRYFPTKVSQPSPSSPCSLAAVLSIYAAAAREL